MAENRTLRQTATRAVRPSIWSGTDHAPEQDAPGPSPLHRAEPTRQPANGGVEMRTSGLTTATGAVRPAVGWRGPPPATTAAGGFYLTMGGIHVGIVAANTDTYRPFADSALFGFVRTGWAEVFM